MRDAYSPLEAPTTGGIVRTIGGTHQGQKEHSYIRKPAKLQSSYRAEEEEDLYSETDVDRNEL